MTMRSQNLPKKRQIDHKELQVNDEEAEIERRRKRREEILTKFNSPTPLLRHAVGAAGKAQDSHSSVSQPSIPRSTRGIDTPGSGKPSGQSSFSTAHQSDLASPRSPAFEDDAITGIDLINDQNLINAHGATKVDDDDGPSAADYDPTNDMKEDERRDELRHGQVVLHGEAHLLQTTAKAEDASKATKKTVENDDGDDDDDFDMFAENFDEQKYTTTKAVGPVEAGELDPEKGGILEGDDKDGYYKMRVGEILDGRYQIQTTLGKGMFSGVVQALDINSKKLVAIKMMRNNDALRKGGYTEIAILQKLNDADLEDRRHIVKFERSFDFRGHLCLAFENLSMNLREVLRKFGNNVGINLMATRAYAHQIFVALAHMRRCSIIHADLKPDNILVNDKRNILKICDLGTAIDRSDAATAHTQITPYLVSRFYRAPEIILGMPYDYGVDMWSIGCTLYEMYTGKILFAGNSNNQMLKAIQEVRGKFTLKLVKRGQLAEAHFDEMGQFVSIEHDKILNKTAIRKMTINKPVRDLRTRLLAASDGMHDAELRELNHFIDLLEHCLALNPDKRMKPLEALKHPFFTAKLGAPKR